MFGKRIERRIYNVGGAHHLWHMDGMHKSKNQPWEITPQTPEDILRMRIAGRIAREVLDAAVSFVKAGVTTTEIDALVHAETIRRNAYPSPLNYHGFPKSCCTSINVSMTTLSIHFSR